MASQFERETSLADPSNDGTENSESLKKAVENHVSEVTLSTSNGSNETPTAGGRANSTENVTDRDGEVETRSSSGPVSQEGAATEEQRANSAGSTHKDSSETPSSESSETIPPFQPRSGTQYQLVFGMDEESSETSITSSPRSSECPSNPLPTLPPPGVQDLIAGNLSHDLFSESQDGDDELLDTTLVEDPSGGDRDGGTGTHDSSGGGGSSRVPGRESLSVYSSSTMVEESPVSAERGKQEASNSDDKLEHLEQSAEESKSLEPKVKEGKPPEEEEEEEGESQRSVDDDVKLEDIRLRTRSESETPPPRPKIHPLSQDTSDSEEDAALPPYSPVEYVPDESEDMEMGNVGPSPLPPGMESPLLLEDQPSMSILFSGLTYLGSSSVDAPISEPEANRKMLILKQQAATSEPIPVVLSIPVSNDGIVYMNDPNTDQPLATFAVKNILFCARGSAEDMHDCFCLNVRHKRSGIYHCHVFRCRIMEACHKIFEAIGKAFKTKPLTQALSPASPELSCEFDVTIEISEDDGKANYSPVPMDKDCFKLRQRTKKKVVFTVAQPNSARPLLVERCFGLLISPGKDVKQSEMNLLDNMNCTNADNVFTVAGFWDISVPFLAVLNEETPKATRHQHMTVAADLVLEYVTEPVRFKREVKVHVSKGDSFGYLMSSLTRRKQSTESFVLSLKKSEDQTSTKLKNASYHVVELRSTRLVRETTRDSRVVNPQQQVATPTSQSPISSLEGGQEREQRIQLIPAEEAGQPSPSSGKRAARGPASKGGGEDGGDSDNSQAVDEFDENVLVSGWGVEEDMREDLLKDWGDLLEKWDGKDRSRPSKLIKLCRKGIPKHLRCQVWQLLSGAAYDPQLYESYRLLINKESPTENVIHWDIKRTYVGHEFFQEELGKDALYKISKAYSVYDEEVGYCQGFSFMAAMLLLQKMPEEQAFSVMVKIMYSYGHRDVFKANFQNLHLMFYQLERLMEEHLPDMYLHFQQQCIETHMYASQWFLTLYTAKFPLAVVFRIIDVYLCERTPVIFQVALGLLKLNRRELLGLDFEGILNYFRVSLPRKFQSEEECKQFFQSIFGFKITERKLKKLDKDYQAYLEQQVLLEDPVMRLEKENKQLRDTILRLERENDHLARELVNSKVTLRAEMDKLEERIDTLSKEGRASKSSIEAGHMQIRELKEELQQAKEEYQKTMVRLTEEKQQHEAAIAEYKLIFQQLDESHQKQKEELNQELMEVKAKLGSVPTGEPEEDSVHHLSSLSSEQRLRNLELELAQTKLALVESQCKNQELEHRLEDVAPPSSSSGGSSGGSSQGHRGSVRSWYFKKKT